MKTQKPYYITTEKISVGYDGKPLIEEVEIALRKGEILTLLGPNGAGKSTILKSIARQLSLIAGTVRLDGEDMKSLTGQNCQKNGSGDDETSAGGTDDLRGCGGHRKIPLHRAFRRAAGRRSCSGAKRHGTGAGGRDWGFFV